MNQNNIKKSHKERKRAGNLQLEMRDVCAFYGEARALNKISFLSILRKSWPFWEVMALVKVLF